jgi:hypothetical protein
VNGGPPAFKATGLPGEFITSTPYTIQGDSGTSVLDRATTLNFRSGASSVTINDPDTGTGMGGNFVAWLTGDGQAVTLNRQTNATFSVFDGVSRTSGLTSTAVNSGEFALISNPNFGCSGAACIWDVFKVNGNAKSLNGTAFSGTNGNLVKFGASNTPADSGIAATAVTQTIASGTASIAASAIASGACQTIGPTSATGVATTDIVMAGFQVDPTTLTGFASSAFGSLFVYAWPTANNVNFKVCNNTANSITPSAATLNWRVVR